MPLFALFAKSLFTYSAYFTSFTSFQCFFQQPNRAEVRRAVQLKNGNALCRAEKEFRMAFAHRSAVKPDNETAPNIHFQILAGDSTENRDRLEKNLVDMGIVREPFNLEPYDQIALRREPWGLLRSRDHPLAAQHPETVPLACLGEVPLMLPARQSLQADIHNWLGQFLPRRNVFCLYNSIFSILGLAQRGLGVILAPQSVWAFIDPASLAYRTLVEPGHQSRIFLVKRRGRLMPPAAARFWEFVEGYSDQKA